MFFLPSRELRQLRFVYGFVYWAIHRWRVGKDDNCDWLTKHLYRFGQPFFFPKSIWEYSSVFDEFDGSVAIERKFELISKFKNEKLFGCGIAVKVLFASTGNVTISLDNCISKLILLKKEWWSNLLVMYWVLTTLIALGMFKILGSQLFFHPDLVQNKLLSLILNTISIK